MLEILRITMRAKASAIGLLLICFTIVLFLQACGSANSATLTNAGSNSGSTVPAAPTISSQPASQSVAVGQTATFSVTAAGTAPLSYQWQKNNVNIASATSSSYATPATASSDNGSTFRVVVSNAAGNVTSNSATLTVTTSGSPPPSNPTVQVLTYHNDVARTGLNLSETTLTPSNVNSTMFGKVGFLSVDGVVDAEPLYVPAVSLGGAAHNVVLVETEQDSAYAFDADSLAQLWHVSALASGEMPSDSRGCSQITPNIGITGTPVVDPSAGTHGTIFFVAMSIDSNGAYHQRLHALDLSAGAEQSGSPVTIAATYPGSGAGSSGGQLTFDPKQYAERSALLLLNGTLYLAWTSHCDINPYTGWIMGYSESSLQQVSVLNVTPNGSEGSIWMAGAGLAADSSNNIYFLDANGTFDTTLNASGFPSSADFGNSFVKISASNNSLAVADYFAMHNTTTESNADQDLGSGGAMVLPDLTDNSGAIHHLAVGAGKDQNIYIVNRDSMGKFNPSNDTAIYQEITSGGLGGGVFSMPAFFNNTVYYAAVGDNLQAFAIQSARLVSPSGSKSSATFPYPGSTPSISANGAASGIVWAVANSGGGVLHAYDATNLSNELYNSNQAGTRDQFADNKFITPMIANGRVFVGTPTGVIVFGLLDQTSSACIDKRVPVGHCSQAQTYAAVERREQLHTIFNPALLDFLAPGLLGPLHNFFSLNLPSR